MGEVHLNPDPSRLNVGDVIDFNITTRYEDHEVIAVDERPLEDGTKGLWVTVMSPGGNERHFEAVRLSGIHCTRQIEDVIE